MLAKLGKNILKAIEILFFLGVEEVKEESRLVIYFISSPQLLKTVDNSVDNLWKTGGKNTEASCGCEKRGIYSRFISNFSTEKCRKKIYNL